MPRKGPRVSPLQAQIEARYGRPIAGILTELYILQDLSEAQVAEIFGVNQTTVHDWLVKSGIPRRKWAFPQQRTQNETRRSVR